jgi:hypothetical protein
MLLTEEKCSPDPFRLICSYRIPNKKDEESGNVMGPRLIPYDKCTEVVVEEALWEKNGDLKFEDSITQTYLTELMLMIRNKQISERKILLAIRCEMESGDLKKLLDSGESPNLIDL